MFLQFLINRKKKKKKKSERENYCYRGKSYFYNLFLIAKPFVFYVRDNTFAMVKPKKLPKCFVHSKYTSPPYYSEWVRLEFHLEKKTLSELTDEQIERYALKCIHLIDFLHPDASITAELVKEDTVPCSVDLHYRTALGLYNKIISCEQEKKKFRYKRELVGAFIAMLELKFEVCRLFKKDSRTKMEIKKKADKGKKAKVREGSRALAHDKIRIEMGKADDEDDEIEEGEIVQPPPPDNTVQQDPLPVVDKDPVPKNTSEKIASTPSTSKEQGDPPGEDGELADPDPSNPNNWFTVGKNGKKIKVPPMTITKYDKYSTFGEIATKLKDFCEGPFEAKTVGKNIMLTLATETDHRKVTRFFEKEEIKYSTYTLKSDKTIKVVIKDLELNTPCELVKEALTELGYTVLEVSQLKSYRGKYPNKTIVKIPIWLVELPRSSKSKEIFHLDSLNYLKVRIESYRRKRGVAQCYNCQAWRHVAKNCFNDAKCVKCLSPHHTSMCSKVKGVDTPECVNCQREGHVASYRGCSKYPPNKAKFTQGSRAPGAPNTSSQKVTRQAEAGPSAWKKNPTKPPGENEPGSITTDKRGMLIPPLSSEATSSSGEEGAAENVCEDNVTHDSLPSPLGDIMEATSKSSHKATGEMAMQTKVPVKNTLPPASSQSVNTPFQGFPNLNFSDILAKLPIQELINIATGTFMKIMIAPNHEEKMVAIIDGLKQAAAKILGLFDV